MSKKTVLTPFSQGEIKISESTLIEGIPHFSRRAIGEWLEYNHPQKAIDKIVERNSYINTYSVTVNMTATDGKKYDTEVYHPIGFLLLVMESNQPKAIKMKQAVAEFVFSFTYRKPSTETTISEQIRLRGQLLKIAEQLTAEKNTFMYQVLKAQLYEVCEQLGQELPDESLLGVNRFQQELIKDS